MMVFQDSTDGNMWVTAFQVLLQSLSEKEIPNDSTRVAVAIQQADAAVLAMRERHKPAVSASPGLVVPTGDPNVIGKFR